MTIISFLPGFQLERLKRRREIQAKLEGVVEEMSQEQREVVDPKLFVGDRGGLKKLETDSRRMVSRPDRQLVFMSGCIDKSIFGYKHSCTEHQIRHYCVLRLQL